MKRIINLLIFSVLLVGINFSCQSNTEKKKVETVSPEQLSEEITSNLPAQTADKVHPGKAVYNKYCLACHQSDGLGVPGMHPPLGPGSWVGKDPKELVAMMIKGLNGKVGISFILHVKRQDHSYAAYLLPGAVKGQKTSCNVLFAEHLYGDLSKRMVPINGSVNFVGRSVNYLFNRYLYCVNKGLIFLASANHHDDPMMVPGRP